MASMNAAEVRAAEVALRAGAGVITPGDTVRLYVMLNQKGGVGKTQLTLQLARELAELGLVVLMVDLDPQGNLTYAVKLLPPRTRPSRRTTRPCRGR